MRGVVYLSQTTESSIVEGFFLIIIQICFCLCLHFVWWK